MSTTIAYITAESDRPDSDVLPLFLAETEAEAQAAPHRPSWWKKWMPLLLLAAMTIVGGALRFYALDRPALWGDEAATYSRICGTFRQLIDLLRVAWFPPLHYVAYWWLSRHIEMDPFGMRLIPAVTGTLMIPAMYFLARQMVGVRASLMTALFTATSAYLLAYSRDGKMYMDFWLFVALSTACLLWWARTGRSTAWLAWIASAAAMVGLHGMGFAVLALHIPFFLTSRNVTGLKAVLLILGIAIACAGDAAHYGTFNAVSDQIERQGWGASGIEWTDVRNEGQPTSLIVADSAAAYLYSFLWIQEPYHGIVIKWIPLAMAWVMGIICAMMLLGAMPWRARADVGDLPPPEAHWRAEWWLGLWLLLPTYGFYCASTSHPLSPMDWLQWAGSLFTGWGWIALALLAVGCAVVPLHRWIGRIVALGMVLTLVWTLISAVAALPAAPDSEAAHSLIETLTQWVCAWGIKLSDSKILGCLLIAVAALWFGRAGSTTQKRLVTILQFVLVVGAILLVCQLAYQGIESYFADKATLLGPDHGERKSIWMPRYVAIVWPPMAIILSVLLMRIPTRPLRWAAVLFVVAINLTQFGARIYAGTEAPLGQIAADMMTGRTNPKVLTLIQDGYGGASPGTANIESLSGTYYIARELKRSFTPFEVRRLYPYDLMATPAYRYPPAAVAQIKRRPALARVVVWTVHPPMGPVRDDGLGKLLGNEWIETDNEIHHVRAFWNWAEFYQYQRREFERK